MRTATGLAVLLLAAAARGQPSARFPDAPSGAPPARTSPPAPGPRPPTPAHEAAPAPAGGAAAPAPGPPRAEPLPSSSLAARVPSGASALVERAERFVAEGRLTEALSAYTEAIRLDGTDGLTVLALARLRLRIRDVQEAERLFSAATRFSDSAARAFAERAELRRTQGRKAEAAQDLEQAHALAPDDPRVAAALAELHVEARAWPRALAIHRRLLAETRDPEVAGRSRLTIRALEVIAAELDPVRSAGREASFTRRSLARLAP